MIEPRACHADCAVCPLYVPPRRKRDPQVNGDGPDRADVVVVGMAPGADEITMRRGPFVGKSGQLLNRLLDGAGIGREQVYVTNAVLCSTHDGKTNQPVPAQAIAACRARLFMEVKARRPKVVVALGNDVLRAFGIDEKISDCRGRERWVTFDDLAAVLLKAQKKTGQQLPVGFGGWERGGFYLLPTFHPAAVIRPTGADRAPDLEKDFLRIPEVLAKAAAEERTFPEVDYRVADTSDDALAMLKSMEQQPVLACDIEATGLDPITGRLLTLAYAWRENDRVRALVIPSARLADDRVRAALHRLHSRRDTRFLWHNGKFDRKWYRHHLAIEARIDGDSMLAHYALDARKGVHGLKERASDDLGAPDYERELKQLIKKHGGWEWFEAADAPLDELYHYTALDVGMTLMLTEKYEREHDDKAAWVYRNILLPAAAVLSDVELAGAAVDVQALQDLDGHFNALLLGYQRQMWDAAGVEFNLASQPQVATILYGHGVRQRFPSIDKSSTRELPTLDVPLQLNAQRTPASGADACDKILNGGGLTERQADFVRALRDYRLDAQLHRTYVKKLPRVVHEDGRVRANFNLHVTTSGRLSSSEPINLQNIPTRRKEGKDIKNAFVAPPGTLLVEVDLSQAELRTAAALSGDPVLTAIYTEGRDFHHEVAKDILGSDELAEKLRPYIKTFNFALMYGAETGTLTRTLNDSAIETEQLTGEPQPRFREDYVQELYDGFWVKFPVLRRWLDGLRRQVRATGEVESHFGRRRRWWIPTPEMEKEAGNHPVQSTAADCLTLGMIEIDRWLKETGYGRIVLTVHDSLVIEAHELAAVHVADYAVGVLRDVPLRHGITVPFVADAKIGQRWASLVKLEDWLKQGEAVAA